MQFQTFGLTWVIVKRRRSVANVTLAVVQWSVCMSLLVFLVLYFFCRSCLYCKPSRGAENVIFCAEFQFLLCETHISMIEKVTEIFLQQQEI